MKGVTGRDGSKGQSVTGKHHVITWESQTVKDVTDRLVNNRCARAPVTAHAGKRFTSFTSFTGGRAAAPRRRAPAPRRLHPEPARPGIECADLRGIAPSLSLGSSPSGDRSAGQDDQADRESSGKHAVRIGLLVLCALVIAWILAPFVGIGVTISHRRHRSAPAPTDAGADIDGGSP